jgi:uncharacterized protein (TIGR00255 family)
MIKSMTAFGACEKTNGKFTVVTEIRSYNSRHLDIVLRIPGSYLSLEEKIKTLISSRITRGRIETAVQIKAQVNDACQFEIDEQKAIAYYNALIQLKQLFGLQSEIPLSLLVGNGIVKPAEVDMDTDAIWDVLRDCLTGALDEIDAMRIREGNAIAMDFEKRINYIEECIDQIQQASAGLLSHYRSRLENRMSILTNGLIEIDPGRLTQEAAFLADRSDISEEIVRALSHIKQFRSLMASEDPTGRKLNFLLQEFNREFNTMGSKADNQNISHIIVDLKSEIEKIREQVQNVE